MSSKSIDFTAPNRRKQCITMIEKRGILQHALSRIFFFIPYLKKTNRFFSTAVTTLYAPKGTFTKATLPNL